MVKAELIKRSPLRVLEAKARGGLGEGNMGAVAAKKGTGKTAFLVHLATDQLFQGRHVIHVSYAARTDHIVDWYEEIFEEIAARYGLEGAREAHDEAVRNRVIMNFNQAGVKASQVTKSLRAMIREGQFRADLIVVDGYDFGKGSPDELAEFKAFAGEAGLEIWFSASLPLEEPVPPGVPPLLLPYASLLALILVLRPEGRRLWLELVKEHERPAPPELRLALDPKTLIILDQAD